MMARCQHCKAGANLYLCNSCTNILANMLAQLPWLITELDNRTHKQTRLNTTTTGRTHRPQELTPIDLDAAETARNTHQLLLQWVKTVAQRHTGRLPAALSATHPKHLAAWLYANLSAITTLNCAGQLYHDIETLVGPDHQRTGQLVTAINPTARHFAGPCPTTTNHTHTGEPIRCDTMLYADTDQQTIQCPTCHQHINVEDNRRKAAADKDLLTVPKLLETMTYLGEPISRATFYRWIREQRIHPRGWIHHGQFTTHWIQRGDPALYSLKRARKLRTREQQRQEANR